LKYSSDDVVSEHKLYFVQDSFETLKAEYLINFDTDVKSAIDSINSFDFEVKKMIAKSTGSVLPSNLKKELSPNYLETVDKVNHVSGRHTPSKDEFSLDGLY